MQLSTRTLTSLGPDQILAGRFRLVRHVGKGGMGDVYEAEDIQLQERVALKTIRPEIASNPIAVARFKREILLGKKVTHPNVCRIHDLGLTEAHGGREMFFLTMEFLHGETLSSRIKREPFTVAEALPLIEDMADGLTAAHNAGVIHRDFKSGNIMLVNSADRVRAIITDFGLARASQAAGEITPLSRAGAVPGTVAYMAPEQIKGEEVTPATDIYALGVVMYEMLTGYCPFAGSSDASIRRKHIHEQPRRPSEWVPELDSNWEQSHSSLPPKKSEESIFFRRSGKGRAFIPRFAFGASAISAGDAGSRAGRNCNLRFGHYPWCFSEPGRRQRSALSLCQDTRRA